MIVWIKEHLEGVLMMSLTVAACITVFYLDVIQPEPAQAAAPTAVDTCELWRTAGGVPVYRCIDEEQYIACYSQGVMLFCVPQQ